MPLTRTILAALLVAAPAAAQDDHDHLSEAGGVRILHAWTTAGSGPARIYMEIENEGEDAVSLTGGEIDGSAAILMGAPMKAGGDPVVLPGLEVAPGRALSLGPDSVYLEAAGSTPRTEGGELDLEIEIAPYGHLDVHVEILGDDATSHPHAGHAH